MEQGALTRLETALAAIDAANAHDPDRSEGAPAAQLYARYRLPEEDAPALPGMRPPAWTFLHGPLSPLSSTALRAAARKPG